MTPWTEEEWTEVLRLKDEGKRFCDIGHKFGLTKNAVQGRIYRRLLNVPSAVRRAERGRPERLPPRPYLTYCHYEPSRTPFASDDTCPDFAWDDDHCGAVLSAGGYPVMPRLADLRWAA